VGQGLEQAWFLTSYFMTAQAGKLQMKSRGSKFHKFQQFINWLQSALQKTATRNGNLQPEIEINEYSSSKKLLE